MKILTFLFLILILAIPAFAQAPFAGGEGDGYASASTTIIISSINDQALPYHISIFPNPAYHFQEFKMEINNYGNRLFLVEIFDLSGHLVYKNKCTDSIFKTQLAKGFYLINIKIEEVDIRKKLIVLGK